MHETDDSARRVRFVHGPAMVVLVGLASGLFRPLPAGGEERDPAALKAASRERDDYFEESVRPVLAKHCFACHGRSRDEANLRLDSREYMLEGGDNGPAIVPGDPEKSLLITALKADGDPASRAAKKKLTAEETAVLSEWIKLGAPWPATSGTVPIRPRRDTFKITGEDRAFWSFKPVVKPALPSVKAKDWPRTQVDFFTLATLEAQGLTPAPQADPRTLIRRVTFDLTGLPPTPAEVESFLKECLTPLPLREGQGEGRANDPQDGIDAKETSGNRPPDPPLTPPWKGGESSLDRAYARLVDRLLASPAYGERSARLWLDVARFGEDQAHTFEARKYPQGFRYRDWLIDAFNRDLPYDQFIRLQIAADLVAEESEKTKDLPALGFFACGPVYYGDKNKMDQVADRIDTVTRGFLGLTVACARCHDHKFDPISMGDYYALAGVFASTDYVDVPLVSPEEVEKAEKAQSDEEKKKKPRAKTYPHVHALKEAKEPKNLRVHIRGNADTLGEEAPRRFVAILGGETKPLSEGSGRKALADAIASPDNPLTARVMVNRLWQQHFGTGLVSTSSNFGALGEKPTDPALLDSLAATFVEKKWSIKAMHREIVLSATYRQGAEHRDQSPRTPVRGFRDHPPRRLDVESWRDAILSVSGRLDRTVGGPSLDLNSPDNKRRTLYAFISRHELNSMLRLFDFPDPNITSDHRAVTTVAIQQLFVLNSEFMTTSARALAKRLQDEAGGDRKQGTGDGGQTEQEEDKARIRLAFELLFARPPSAKELELGAAYLAAKDPANEDSKQTLTRWERYCQALLCTNEFMYVD